MFECKTLDSKNQSPSSNNQDPEQQLIGTTDKVSTPKDQEHIDRKMEDKEYQGQKESQLADTGKYQPLIVETLKGSPTTIEKTLSTITTILHSQFEDPSSNFFDTSLNQ